MTATNGQLLKELSILREIQRPPNNSAEILLAPPKTAMVIYVSQETSC
ncbi:hypothetical protein CCP3SC15_290003 [Gammaproteobacteria bacterium]